MSDFEDSYKKLIGHEGEYSHDPNDNGGETYKGISRVHHPDWEGWKIIDEAKNKPNFPINLRSNQELENLVMVFYKQYYWDKIKLDNINSPKIKYELFEIGVNMGLGIAVKFLQESINLLNRNKKNYTNIEVDGNIGTDTLLKTQKLLDIGDEHILFNLINMLQGERYIEICRRNETQETFIRGWLNRIDIVKN